MTIPDQIAAILACPKCRASLHATTTVGKISGTGGPTSMPADSFSISGGAITALECRSCGLRYPVRDGIPVLLMDQAERVEA